MVFLATLIDLTRLRQFDLPFDDVSECDRRPDDTRSKLLAGLAHTLTDLADFPAGELGESARLGLKGARQIVTVARTGVADRRPGIGMPQHIAALEILPVGGFLQHQILGEMVAIVTHMQPRHEDRLAAARARTAFHALRVGGAAKPGDAEALQLVGAERISGARITPAHVP